MKSALSLETLARVVAEVLKIEATIEEMERTTPHDELPPEYDALITRREAGRALIKGAGK